MNRWLSQLRNSQKVTFVHLRNLNKLGFSITKKYRAIKQDLSYDWVFCFFNKWLFKMEHKTECVKPPSIVRGMTCLDRDKFTVTFKVPYVVIPITNMHSVLKAENKRHLLKIHRVAPVQEPTDENKRGTHKMVLFNPDSVKENKVALSDFDFVNVPVSYENWLFSDIMRAVLPLDIETVGGFSTIGHIVHFNLREDVLEYKNLIGSVALDKVVGARTVVNKVNVIDNKFRNFQMEVIAGEEDFVTTVKANGVSFTMDFSKVYWNPKLGTEHERILKKLNAGDVVLDMFAGIGPFAVPAARKQCIVLANDLNPESFKWLNTNIRQNRRAREQGVHTFNMDGREFMTSAGKDYLVQLMQKEKVSEGVNVHILMNLPALAIEFTDVFVGLLSNINKTTLSRILLPRVHCYCFSNADDKIRDVKSRVEAVMKHPMPGDCTVRFVRNVAPSKDMMCIEFQLTESVLFDSAKHEESLEPSIKKQKVD